MLPANKALIDERPSASRYPSILFIIGLISLCLAFYFEPLFLHKPLFWRDISQLYKPLFSFVRETLWQGKMPLWNPYLFNGTPLLAGAEPAVFYPGNILFWLLDFYWAYPLSLIMHHLLAAYGMYRLGKSLSWTPTAASLAALSFAFSGIMISMNNFYPLLTTSIWIPFIFDSAYNVFNQPRRRSFYTALLALFLGLQILSGHFEIVAMTGLLLLLNLLPPLIQTLQTGKERVRVLFWGALALLLSLGFSMVQFWPSYELLQLSDRVSDSFSQNNQLWSLHPISFLALLIPNFHGNLFSDNHLGIFLSEPKFGRSFFFLSHYLGLSALILAAMGITSAWKSKERLQTIVWILSLLLCLGLAMGSYGFFYDGLLKSIPIFSVFRYPVKFLIPAVFFFSLLSASGLNQWLKNPKGFRFAPYFLMVWIGFLSVVSLVLHFKPTALIQKIWPALEKLYGSKLSTEYFLLIQNMFVDLKLNLLINILMGLVLVILLLFFINKEQYLKYAGITLIIFLSLELFYTGQSTLWTMNQNLLETSSPVLDTIKNDMGTQEYLRIAQNSTGSMTLPSDIQREYQQTPHIMMQVASQRQVRNNRSMQTGFFHVGGYSPARTQVMDQVLNLFEMPGISNSNKSQLESIMSVGYVINGSNTHSQLSQRLQSSRDYQALTTDPSPDAVQVWKRKNTLPRVYFRHLALVNKDRPQIINALAKAQEIGFDAQQHVLIEDNSAHQKSLLLAPATQNQSSKPVKPRFQQISNQHLNIQVSTDRSGYLVLTDQYYPGWKAFDNGQETPILNANYFQRAIRLAPGEHQIKFVFQPLSFIWGRWLSLLGLLGIAIMLWLNRKSNSISTSFPT